MYHCGSDAWRTAHAVDAHSQDFLLERVYAGAESEVELQWAVLD